MTTFELSLPYLPRANWVRNDLLARGGDRKCCVDVPYHVCWWSPDCNSTCVDHKVAIFSNCPSVRWMDALSHVLVPSTRGATLINVGANKGYDVREFFERYDQAGAPSGDKWLRALLKNNVTAQPCGACGACGHRVRRHSGRVRVATAIAVEAEPQNAKVLRRLFRAFGLAERGAEVVHAAVGDGMGGGMASVAVSKEVGDERGSIVDGGKRATVGVKATTIDELVRRYQLRVVDWCLIDAEGHDHAILRGAEASIKQNRLRVIAFEYGAQWCQPGLGGGCVPLQPTIAFLAAHGYRCWWLGNGGRVAPVSARCRDISTRRWSNIACVSESVLVTAMQSLEAF